MIKARARNLLYGKESPVIESDWGIEIVDTESGVEWNIRVEDSNLIIMTSGKIHIVPRGAVNTVAIMPHEQLARRDAMLTREPDRVVRGD